MLNSSVNYFAKFQRKDFRNAFLAYRLLYSRMRLQRYEYFTTYFKKKSKIFYTLFICLIIKTMPTLLNIFGQRFLFLNAVDEDKVSIY